MENEKEWAEIIVIQKEITFIYHQLSNYKSIGPDLEYSTQINYWDYFNLPAVDVDVKDFINEGVLVLIGCILADVFEGASSPFFTDHIEEVIIKIEAFNTSDFNLDKIKEQLLIAINQIKNDEFGFRHVKSHKVFEDFQTIHSSIVLKYFKDRLTGLCLC